MEGMVPMTEEIATETWEDVNSISVFGKGCAYELVVFLEMLEFLLAGELV
jgi:hypothetical protein